MKDNYSPSVNIIRDAQKELKYIVTENAEKSAIKILNDFNKGFHSFNIIGSFGTGKSSFLWAFQQTVIGKKKIFDVNLPHGTENVKVVNIVGGFHSLINVFNEIFSVSNDFSSNQNLFDEIFQTYSGLGKNGLLIIAIDEFGKFLEYSAKNNPEKELYFVQQLAEFVNDPNRKIILLTTLHQGFDSYANYLSDTQKNEWRKVKGRFQEITFNEPVEQLLTLASKHFISQIGETKETDYSKMLIQLQKNKNVFSANTKYFEELKNALYPLDIFSAFTLTLALQKFGQNERSLFSFLQASENFGLSDKNNHFNISAVYDFLIGNYYHQLTSKANPDYSNWSAIKNALQRIETIEVMSLTIAEELIKIIGLLQIFASKGAKTDNILLLDYLSDRYRKADVQKVIDQLEKKKVIRFFKFNFSYKLFEGTDLDIEDALLRAENQVAEVTDLVPKLKSYFDFPIVIAKANSYKTGTPRLFEFELSENPISKTPKGEIDGFINLIFNTKHTAKAISDKTQYNKEAILYGFFKNSDKISLALFDIEKTNQVLKNIEGDGDRVAIKELQSILKSNTVLLNHYVLDALFNENDVDWIYKGKKVKIRNRKDLNKKLSAICDDIYSETPVIKNELFNKHKVSGAIASARKNYFEALVNHFDKDDLGFDKEKFPPEKTIYYTLLRKNGIHIKTKSGYTLTKPDIKSEIYKIWEVCEHFLSSAKHERKSISELINTLTSAPYKVKQGVVDFWVPTFLFIRKGDYALYSEEKFKPYINQQELYLITRVPQNYKVKSFELNDLKLSFFNKYRELLRQNESKSLNVNSFIESIRPILLTFKNLTAYSQKTRRLSKEAIKLRDAIRHAQDPEKVFFDEFPNALGFDTAELLNSNRDFDDYIYKFQITLDEIRESYTQLLNRIEIFITDEIIGYKCQFEVYKKELAKRFSTLKEHQLLTKQKTFLQRVNSPLNDRDSWLASIGQVMAGKPLTAIDDNDEDILKDNLKHIIVELDNLAEIENVKFDVEREEIFKLDFTSKTQGLVPHLIRIQKNKLGKAQKHIEAIQKELGSDKQMRIAILAKLLKEELDNE